MEEIPGLALYEDTIDIDGYHLFKILLGADFQALVGYKRARICGRNYTIHLDDMSLIFDKLCLVGIRNLYMGEVSFESFAEEHVRDIPLSDNCYRQQITSLILEMCPKSYWFLLYLFPKINNIYQCRFPLLSTIIVWGSDSTDPTCRLFVEILKNNYRIKRADVSTYLNTNSNGIPYDNRMLCCENRDLEEILVNYINRNKLGYEKCVKSCVTILGLRRFRHTFLSIVDKNVILAVCKVIFSTIGTKVWCEQKYDQ